MDEVGHGHGRRRVLRGARRAAVALARTAEPVHAHAGGGDGHDDLDDAAELLVALAERETAAEHETGGDAYSADLDA